MGQAQSHQTTELAVIFDTFHCDYRAKHESLTGKSDDALAGCLCAIMEAEQNSLMEGLRYAGQEGSIRQRRPCPSERAAPARSRYRLSVLSEMRTCGDDGESEFHLSQLWVQVLCMLL